MRLTLHTDYALRALMYLGLRGGSSASIRDISEAYGISEHHMTKVIHGLGRAGFVATRRGRGGGLRLAMRPEQIAIGSVVRHTEEDMALVPCFSGREGCAIDGPCRLQPLLAEAMAAFMAVLDGATLADLIGPGHREMAGRLGMFAPERT